jgi:hypothetical protein
MNMLDPIHMLNQPYKPSCFIPSDILRLASIAASFFHSISLRRKLASSISFFVFPNESFLLSASFLAHGANVVALAAAILLARIDFGTRRMTCCDKSLGSAECHAPNTVVESRDVIREELQLPELRLDERDEEESLAVDDE